MEYYGNNDYRDYLMHYGVKGMKWGKHLFAKDYLVKLRAGARSTGSGLREKITGEQAKARAEYYDRQARRASSVSSARQRSLGDLDSKAHGRYGEPGKEERANGEFWKAARERDLYDRVAEQNRSSARKEYDNYRKSARGRAETALDKAGNLKDKAVDKAKDAKNKVTNIDVKSKAGSLKNKASDVADNAYRKAAKADVALSRKIDSAKKKQSAKKTAKEDQYRGINRTVEENVRRPDDIRDIMADRGYSTEEDKKMFKRGYEMGNKVLVNNALPASTRVKAYKRMMDGVDAEIKRKKKR